jgi:hypothetical protein
MVKKFISTEKQVNYLLTSMGGRRIWIVKFFTIRLLIHEPDNLAVTWYGRYTQMKIYLFKFHAVITGKNFKVNLYPFLMSGNS